MLPRREEAQQLWRGFLCVPNHSAQMNQEALLTLKMAKYSRVLGFANKHDHVVPRVFPRRDKKWRVPTVKSTWLRGKSVLRSWLLNGSEVVIRCQGSGYTNTLP